MKFAMVSDAQFNGRMTSISGNVFDWGTYLEGQHFWIHDVKKDWTRLNEFDVVMILDLKRWLDLSLEMMDVAQNPLYLFYPEGGDDIYFSMTFEEQKRMFRILKRVDLIGCADERWIDFYNSLFGDKAFFMHVPMPDVVTEYRYWRNYQNKSNDVLLCCNLGLDELRYKTNLINMIAVIKKSGVRCTMVEIDTACSEFVSGFFDMIITYSPRVDMVTYMDRFVSRHLCLLNLSDIIGTSRNAIIGASCGTPVIGNIRSHTQKRLFPGLAVDPLDIEGAANRIKRLIEDKYWYSKVVDFAKAELPYYSKESAMNRLKTAIESKAKVTA